VRVAKGILLIATALLWAFPKTQAVPLYLSPPANSPDLFGSFQSVSYSAGSGLFEALGYTTDYANGSATLVDIGDYRLIATITSAGVMTSGSLNIEGDIGSGLTTLLTGALTGFGFSDSGGNIFEFLFTVTGGDPLVVGDFGGVGATSGGVILDAWFGNGGNPFTGSWELSFWNDGWSGVSDAFSMAPPASVPEPTSNLVTIIGSTLWVGLMIVGAGRNSLKLRALRNA
jgi:hypothetical protein